MMWWILLHYMSSSCSKCGGLLRPHVVWFGEPLEVHVMDTAQQILRECDLCLLVRELCACVCGEGEGRGGK